MGFETKMNKAQTNLSRRDSLKIARRFNAGIGLDGASSPAGTAENARPFLPSLRDSVNIASQPGVETPGYCRSSLRDKIPARQTNLSKLAAAASWSAPALWRFGRREAVGQKSGRGLPQSKTRRGFGHFINTVASARC